MSVIANVAPNLNDDDMYCENEMKWSDDSVCHSTLYTIYMWTEQNADSNTWRSTSLPHVSFWTDWVSE